MASIRTYAAEFTKILEASIPGIGVTISALLGQAVIKRTDAHHEQLERLALIWKNNTFWSLIYFGEKFVAAVTNLSIATDQTFS